MNIATLTILNPLNWTAGPFLLLYVALAGLAWALATLLRRRLGGTPAWPPATLHDPLDYAYLARGPQHVADTVLIRLMQAGIAWPAQASRQSYGYVMVDLSAGRLPPELQRFADLPSGLMTRKQFRDGITGGIERLTERLRARGLAPSVPAIADFQLAVVLLTSVPIIIGLARVAVGLARERPVNLLLLGLYAVTAYVIYRVARAPTRTRAGAAALAATRRANARAARAPLGPEIPLAFAISGAAVLDGTPLAAFAGLIRRDGISSGSDSSGGGCGGGGDGGCGGCG